MVFLEVWRFINVLGVARRIGRGMQVKDLKGMGYCKSAHRRGRGRCYFFKIKVIRKPFD